MNQFTNGEQRSEQVPSIEEGIISDSQAKGAVPNAFQHSDNPASELNSRERAAHPDALVSRVVTIQRSDRWQVYRRLKELGISCWCPQDGTLWVEIEGCVGATLLRSTVHQFTSSRLELADWLDRCWTTSILATSHH